MNTLIKCAVIVGLTAVYGMVLAAILHPHVSAEYRGYFIDHTSLDANASHYDTTPEEGMIFNRTGLPQWVLATHGLSVRDDWGRWTDASLSPTAGLTFNRAFEGDLCVDLLARAVQWVVGQPVDVQLGSETRSFRISGEGLTEYRLQFWHLQGAHELNIILPPHLPRVVDRAPAVRDGRRLGMDISLLQLIPGECPASTK